MSRVRGKNTRPEILVRSLIHKLGYRYRIHVRKLPGTPDLVFASHHKVIFVHGCFWHGHNYKHGSNLPKANAEYGLNKIQGNKVRDADNFKRLKQISWQFLIIWECELDDKQTLEKKILNYLNDRTTLNLASKRFIRL